MDFNPVQTDRFMFIKLKLCQPYTKTLCPRSNWNLFRGGRGEALSEIMHQLNAFSFQFIPTSSSKKHHRNTLMLANCECMLLLVQPATDNQTWSKVHNPSMWDQNSYLFAF